MSGTMIGAYNSIIGTVSSTVYGSSSGGPTGQYLTFAPSAGAGKFIGFGVTPVINETSTATGNYTALQVNATETSFLGTTALLADFQVGGTSKASIDHSGNILALGGMALDTPTGGNEGAGTINVATGYYANGTAGISSSGVLCTATFASVDGLTTACTAVSDPRLKDYVPSKRGLADVMRLQPIDFTYNALAHGLYADLPTALQTGFNAKNLQDVMPEAVSSDDKGFLQLPQGDRPIVAALVKGMQEQQAEIEALKAEVAALKAH
jgi:hypothetical protein